MWGHETKEATDEIRYKVAFPDTPRDRLPKAPFPICFTQEALETLLGTVGSLPPETGAKAFGTLDKMGIDLIEFDEAGSRAARGGLYSPDVEWGEQRLRYHLDQPGSDMRLWTGDIHSHPGGFGWPSHKDGKGTGDLGYVEEVFAQNEAMQWFLIPILTNTGGGQEVGVHPWVCKRAHPLELYWAEFKVCPVTEFPARQFNPAWEAASGHEPDGVRVAPPLPGPKPEREGFELDLFKISLGADASAESYKSGAVLLRFAKEDVACTVVFFPDRPWEKPVLVVRHGRWETRFTQFNWRRHSNSNLAVRLARLCSVVVELTRSSF